MITMSKRAAATAVIAFIAGLLGLGALSLLTANGRALASTTCRGLVPAVSPGSAPFQPGRLGYRPATGHGPGGGGHVTELAGPATRLTFRGPVRLGVFGQRQCPGSSPGYVQRPGVLGRRQRHRPGSNSE